MTIPRRTSSFVRLPQAIVLYSATLSSDLAETTVPIASVGGQVPPLTSAIRVFGFVTPLAGGFGSTLTFRDFAGGSDVATACSTVVGISGFANTLLDLNGGQVTFAATHGTATSYSVAVRVTGYLRYA